MWFSSGAHDEALRLDQPMSQLISNNPNYLSHHRARQKSCSPDSATSQKVLKQATLLLITLLSISDLLTSSHHHNQQQASHSSSYLPLAYAMQNSAPQQANSIQGLHQAMSQMLQVFSGNDSSQLDANNFKLLELAGEDTLLVGARNFVYNLSLSTMREQRRLEWTSNEDDVRMCRMKGKSYEQCQNYIRVIKMDAPDKLLVCGTNAYRPRCREYYVGVNDYEQINELQGEGACPYQENQNVTSTFTDGHLYSATVAQFNGIDGLIHRPPLRTEQFNPKQLNSPNFVSSFRYGEHVYFLFREIAIEHINCGKTIYSRIARVCLNDAGGPTRANRERWTSFVKARLNCSIPGDFPFQFDEIQASTHVVSSAYQPTTSGPARKSWAHLSEQQQQYVNASPQNDLLYAIFTTPTNSIGGSAVCAYRMVDVLAAFEGPFKGQLEGSNSNWLPVPESRVPQSPRPGSGASCADATRRLPEEHINFIKDNPLMDSPVEPIWSQPLITMASINFRFTQIAVDVQVETSGVPGAPAMRTDVIFVGTDDGRVFKLINAYHLSSSHMAQKLPISTPTAAPLHATPPLYPASGPAREPAPLRPVSMAQQGGVTAQANQKQPEQLPDVSTHTLVIEELHLFDARTPIVGLLIHRAPPTHTSAAFGLLRNPAASKLIVLSGRQLKAIPLARCERALTCQDCLALYDPYCAWDLQLNACTQLGRGVTPTGSGSQELPAPELRHNSGGWFPANVTPTQPPNNHTFGWWSSCPLEPTGVAAVQQVGVPVRSLFASHLQVPNRFDYSSGHHLSRTSLVSLAQMTQAPASSSSAAAAPASSRGPASECLTFCGGVYTPTLDSSMAGSCAEQLLQSAAAANQYQHTYGGSQLLTGSPLYTSENLYFAVIICALLGLVLGLLFGFAMGRNGRASKNDSSICSSTFADETNLYMASTGSHHCQSSGVGGALFAAPAAAHASQQSTAARLASHPAFLAAQQHQAMGVARLAPNSIFNSDAAASQCLLATAAPSDHSSSGLGSTSTYANNNHSQQHLFHLRTGALPPIPTGNLQQQPLINTAATTTHLNQAQLTPGSGSQNSSTSSSGTMPAGSDHQQQQREQQFYLNHQHMGTTTKGGVPGAAAAGNTAINHHQRSFTNGSNSSASAPANNNNNNLNSSFQQQQQQANNNKIYL